MAIKVPTTAGLRTFVLFVVGVGGIIYELVVTGTDRPVILILLGMFAGLPIVIQADDILKRIARLPPVEKEAASVKEVPDEPTQS